MKNFEKNWKLVVDHVKYSNNMIPILATKSRHLSNIAGGIPFTLAFPCILLS